MSDNPTRDEIQLRAYENAFKLVRRTLGLPDESPDDGGDLQERLRQVERLKEREAHFASVLGVADGGRYRADWDGRLEAVIAERDRLITRLEAAEKERDEWQANSLAAQEQLSRALVREADALRWSEEYKGDWHELMSATGAGLHLSLIKMQHEAALKWIADTKAENKRLEADALALRQQIERMIAEAVDHQTVMLAELAARDNDRAALRQQAAAVKSACVAWLDGRGQSSLASGMNRAVDVGPANAAGEGDTRNHEQEQENG